MNLTFVNVGICGTGLAPGAAVNFQGGQINSRSIAGSLSGNGPENNGGSTNGHSFAGVLPNGAQIAVVAEPSSVLVMLFGTIGLLLMIIARRRVIAD